MKGLKEYIKKHGKHFTEKLAYDVTGGKWNVDRVNKSAQKKVYYNVTEATLGDILYITNEVHNRFSISTVDKCVKFALYIIGDYSFHGGMVFMDWVDELNDTEDSFDFTPYI